MVDIHSREYLKYLKNYSLQEKRWIPREFERFSDGNSSYGALDIDVKRALIQPGVRQVETSATRAFLNDSIFMLGAWEQRQLLYRNLCEVA